MVVGAQNTIRPHLPDREGARSNIRAAQLYTPDPHSTPRTRSRVGASRLQTDSDRRSSRGVRASHSGRGFVIPVTALCARIVYSYSMGGGDSREGE